MGLRQVEYVDGSGRRWLRGVPEHLSDAHASSGVPLGPPPLDDLGLPKEVLIRLHNELFARRILTANDARQRPQEIISALSAAFRVDAVRIVNVYQGVGTVNGKPVPVTVEPKRK